MNNFYQKLAHLLPQKIVYFCYIRFMAEVTTYEEGGTYHPNDMNFEKANELWERKYGKI